MSITKYIKYRYLFFDIFINIAYAKIYWGFWGVSIFSSMYNAVSMIDFTILSINSNNAMFLRL